MVSALASSWPSPPELETPRKKEESLKALKALVRDWDLLGEGRGGERDSRWGGSGGEYGRGVGSKEGRDAGRDEGRGGNKQGNA